MRAILHRSSRGDFLRRLSVPGLALVVLGAAGLRPGHFSDRSWTPAVDVGSIDFDTPMGHRVPAPTVTGFLVLPAGPGFFAIRWRRA